MVSVLRPGDRIHNIPGIGVQTSRRAVGGGNGLLNSLIAYWPLNEAGGANNALDLHANALTLTQTASPGSAAGKVYAGARTFNGTTQYFSRASEALLQPGDTDWTIAAWVLLTSKLAVSSEIVAKWDSTVGNDRSFLLRYQVTPVDAFRFLVSGDGVASTIVSDSTTPATGTWYLVVASHDSVANTVGIAINSGTMTTTAHSSGVFASTARWQLAAQGSASTISNFLNGRIGPVAMWKSAAGAGGVLSSSQRSALWNAGAGLPYASFTV